MKIGNTEYKIKLKPDIGGIFLLSGISAGVGGLVGVFSGLRVQGKREAARIARNVPNLQF